MLNIMDWIDKVTKWFNASKADKDSRIINDSWTVNTQAKNPSKLMVAHDFVPFTLNVDVGEKVMNIILYTTIETATWPTNDRLKLYRDLLIRNDESVFVKFILAGRNDSIALRMDLNLVYLNKTEFNDSLEAMIDGGYWLLNKLEISEKEEILMKNIIGNIQKRLNQGYSEKKIITEMINAGIIEDDAIMLVKETQKRMKEGDKVEQEEEDDTDKYIR
jgi:hypothetical protein